MASLTELEIKMAHELIPAKPDISFHKVAFDKYQPVIAAMSVSKFKDFMDYFGAVIRMNYLSPEVRAVAYRYAILKAGGLENRIGPTIDDQICVQNLDEYEFAVFSDLADRYYKSLTFDFVDEANRIDDPVEELAQKFARARHEGALEYARTVTEASEFIKAMSDDDFRDLLNRADEILEDLN